MKGARRTAASAVPSVEALLLAAGNKSAARALETALINALMAAGFDMLGDRDANHVNFGGARARSANSSSDSAG